MNVGDYVRTNDGKIGKIGNITRYAPTDNYCMIMCENFEDYENNIIKSSPKIIDLIEVGDYVNGARVTNFMFDNDKKIGVFVETTAWGYDANEIKSIVTREMFESMEYKVGE